MVPQLHEAAPWPHRDKVVAPRGARRIVRGVGIGVVALAALLVIAAWAVPPMLDWGRFRASIASIAGAQLGRTVQIGGDVSLRLFPQAVLTASDVTLPAQGDGMSARIANLRIEVALGPLLAGRLVVRDLVLGGPVVTLPWPLPGSLVNPVRPHVPHPFAAHVENGTLHIGLAAITGITAAIHGGPGAEPAAGQAPDAPPLAAFGAEGFAAFDGQRWRFTTALGAPDADGVSAVDLAMQGQGPAHDTGGALQGTLSDGILQGHLHAAGPNLALIMPSSPLSWQADAPFVATGERIVSSALHMSLGGAPASATLALQLAAPSRLDVRLTASTLDLDGWSRLLNGSFAGFDLPSIPMRLDLTADSASLLGGVLGGLSGVLLLDGGHATLENLTAHLPGDAKLDFSGKIARGDHALLTVEGPATLDAPDLHATLAWLHPLAPPLLDAVPSGVLRSARLAGTARLTPGAFSTEGLTGSMDGVPMSGGFDLAFGNHPHFDATLSFDHLSIDDWLGGQGWGRGSTLAEAARSFTGVDSALHLRIGSARWNGQDLHDVALDAATGAAGLAIDHATAGLADTTLDFAGVLGPDGKLADVHGQASTKDAAALLAKLPPAWRWAPGVWNGQAQLAFSAEGPPDALSLQLRASAGDLVAEAESVRDTLGGTAETTLTVRHPGAPRLLAALGVPGAEHFLETGSFAFLAHLHSAPGHVQVKDFTLDAASAHIGGHGDLDLSGTEPGFDFDVQSASLALPDLATLRSARLPAAKAHGQMRLSAQDVAVGGALVAHGLDATFTTAGGAVLVDKLTANLAGGQFAGEWALDTTQEQPATALRGVLTGLDLSGVFPSMAVGLDTGKADITLDVDSAGLTEPAMLSHLSGALGFTLHDAHLVGFDLNRVDTLLAAHGRPARAALAQALSQGSSGGFSGSGALSMAQGKLTVAALDVSSGDGAVSATGTLDLPAGGIDLSVSLTPAVPNPPHYALKLTGTSHDLKVQPDLGKFSPPHPTRAMRRPSKT
jgi:hypothetical protein